MFKFPNSQLYMFKLHFRHFLFFLIFLVTCGFWLYWHPAIPSNSHKMLFEGITYIRNVRHIPRPIIIHVVTVDLTNPHICFLVTPGEKLEGGEISARTTSQFLTEFKLQLAVNGSFFYRFSPLFSVKFWEAYPAHRGDPVNVLGFASSRGQIYSKAAKKFKTFYISADNKAQFQKPISTVYNAISGQNLLIKNGKIQNQLTGKFKDIPYPRTAFALDKTATTFMIFVVDGKQKNYSEGVTLIELAEIVQANGADTALNMDGGGSVTLVMEGVSGKPILLNSPINGRIRGYERLIANHLGIYAHCQPSNKREPK